MPFAGAFVVGGLFLAVASDRRLRRPALAVAAVLALMVVSTPLTVQPRADAAGGQAQVTLVCVYEAQGSDPNDVPKDQPTGFSISLDVPRSVTPGQVVTLTGSASVQAPEDIRRQASQLGYTTLDAISDSMSVGLTIGSGKRQVFTADRWQTGKTAFSNPLVVRGPLNFPSFKVPNDAKGSIALELPRNEVVNRRPPPYRNAHTPPKVAVEFLASVSGNGTSATYIVSCWRNDKGSGLIAKIPVAAPGAQSGTVAGSTGATTAGGAATAATPAGTAKAQKPGQAAGGVPTATAATTAASPLLQGATANPMPVSSPTSQDIVVPTWLAVLLGALALGGYGFATFNYLVRSRNQRNRANA
jgi:hypothetical protein